MRLYCTKKLFCRPSLCGLHYQPGPSEVVQTRVKFNIVFLSNFTGFILRRCDLFIIILYFH